ncbi:MAG: hypothetical protein GY800_01175 [Planctomycetes bacterium]|nr:hypothetical protein [Planctomycetota bacterium]
MWPFKKENKTYLTLGMAEKMVDLKELSEKDHRVHVGDEEVQLVDPDIVKRITELKKARMQSWRPVKYPAKE